MGERKHPARFEVMIDPKKTPKRYMIIDQRGPGTGKEIICTGVRFLDEAQVMANALNEYNQQEIPE